jgi:hypothetical protein
MSDCGKISLTNLAFELKDRGEQLSSCQDLTSAECDQVTFLTHFLMLASGPLYGFRQMRLTALPYLIRHFVFAGHVPCENTAQ